MKTYEEMKIRLADLLASTPKKHPAARNLKNALEALDRLIELDHRPFTVEELAEQSRSLRHLTASEAGALHCALRKTARKT